MGGEARIGRRKALGLLARAGGIAAGSHLLGLLGCESGPPPLRLSATGFPEGARVRVVWADGPVEVVRQGGSIAARSLRCTHEGCEVRWEERGHRYVCPCHGGVYDAAGKPTAGPPKLPLETVPVRLDGADLVLGS